MYAFPLIPTPPLTTNAPVVVEEDLVVPEIPTLLPTFTLPYTPIPPPTINAPVDALVEVVTLGIYI